MGSPATWEDLVRREPRLEALRTVAGAVTSEGDPHFCANATWFGWPGAEPGLKPRLLRLVGWLAESDDPVLRTAAAYDRAYHTIYEELPACERCGCL